MNAFCPSCDKNVEVKDLTERCPQCHRAVIGGPQAPAPATSNRRRVLAIAAVVVAVAAGVAWWSCCGAGCCKKPVAAAAAPAGESLTARLAKAGLAGEAAVAPGTPDDAMKKAVAGIKDGAALASYVKLLVAPGKLQLQPTTQRRGHPALASAKLFGEVVAGTARPVHAVEAAFLVAALAQAHGDAVTFLTDAGGIQSPLLLSKTRVAVKLADGTVIEPFATGALQKPHEISVEQAAAWWLVLAAAATAHLANVTVLDTSRYAVSAGTFPAYFLKRLDQVALTQIQLDLRLFAQHLAPAFHLACRFVGREPLCPATAAYNRAMAEVLEEYGIRWQELERLAAGGAPISASRVRRLLADCDFSTLGTLVPPVTLDYLQSAAGQALAARLRARMEGS